MTLEVTGICKAYTRKVVLEDVSFAAEKGSCIGLLGANGSGKSTLLSILAGVQPPDKGRFMYKNEDMFKNSGFRTHVTGYVPQGNPLMEELTAWDNLRMWYDKETLQRELSEGVLALLGIHEFLKVPVSKMSGGMKKRLSVGCVVAAGPEILLLDEPTASLDIVCKEKIYEYLVKFRADGGILLLATHDIREMELCDSCFILKEGRLQPYTYDGNISSLIGKL